MIHQERAVYDFSWSLNKCRFVFVHFVFLPFSLCFSVFVCSCVCGFVFLIQGNTYLSRGTSASNPFIRKYWWMAKILGRAAKKLFYDENYFWKKKKEEREMRDKKSICHRLPPDIRHLLPPDVHFKEVCVSLSHFCVLSIYVCVFLWSCLCLKDFSQCTKLQRRECMLWKHCT